jgi:hypothetical protein
MSHSERYHPTAEDRQLFQHVRDLVRFDPDRFKLTGAAIDHAYTSESLAGRVGEMIHENMVEDKLLPSAAMYEVETLDSVPLTLIGRFGVAWIDAFGDIKGHTSLSVLPDAEQIELASQRVLLAWLYLDPDHIKIARITSFQELQIAPYKDGMPPLWVADEKDIPDSGRRLIRHSDGSIGQDAYIWIPKLKEAYELLTRSPPKKEPVGNALVKPGDAAEEEEQPPALIETQRVTLVALATIDPSRLASIEDVCDAMPGADRISVRTARVAITKLIELDLAERPNGDKQGARLTIKGRRLATKLAD